ncbi:MAG: hypothetical protein Kow0063_19830 [Anaerolineae bacterium]
MGKSRTVRFPSGEAQISRNGRSSQSDDADARYAAALKLVQAIDHNLRNGTQHYYDTQGRLLQTLDEVIHAMLNDSLAPGKPTGHPQKAEAVQWIPVSELVA